MQEPTICSISNPYTFTGTRMQAFTVGKQWLSMRIMSELLRRNRAPAEVMLVLEDEDTQLQKAFAKAGCNEPCPCGSGRTFKQCYGR